MTAQGQVEKRLQIIKIAISITDEGTINLQRLKLKKYKDNKQLDTILSVLDDENYAQASKLIDRYVQNVSGKTKSRVVSPQKSKVDTEEEELIKKFGLFTEPGRNNQSIQQTIPQDFDPEYVALPTETIELDDEIFVEEQVPQESQTKQTITDDILAQYNSIQTDRLPEKKLIKEWQEEIEPNEPIELVDEGSNREIREDIEASLQIQEEYREVQEQHSAVQEESEVISKEEISQEETTQQSKRTTENITYTPISYIDQKFRNMLNQYPQVVDNPQKFASEDDLLYEISLNGYTEEDIEQTIATVYTLSSQEKLDEAAHLLLIAAATESLYAQFILARELFKGKILQKNLTEAFTQINKLAMDNYPEAVCDLAQFYEYGIGIGKDKKKAFRLYEDALDLGVKRADAHLIRMEEESKGILSKIFNK